MQGKGMEIRFWGVRGSYPASGAGFSAYGHHTACVSVAAGDDLIVLDAGSGAAALAAVLPSLPHRRLHLLLSHFHHDHLMGLPYLLHAATGRGGISIHAALGADVPLKDILERLFSAPYFPVSADLLMREVTFHAHAVGASFPAGEVAIRTGALDHPGGCAAFRLDHAGRGLLYATDLESRAEAWDALVALASEADLVIHDTMFTPEEAEAHRGWGHSTAESALALVRQAGVPRLVGFHHNPRHDDGTLSAREAWLAARHPGFSFAREGGRITLA